MDLLWKPLKTLIGKDNPVLFDEIGNKIINIYGVEKGIRPFVIFYDDETRKYWYVKARDAENKTIQKGEILIKKQKDGGLFEKDSLVDCSQIFVMDKDELEHLIDFDADIFLNTEKLTVRNINKIKKEILNCIFDVPPYLSIMNVYINKFNRTEGNSLYLNKEKFDELYDKSIKLLEIDENHELGNEREPEKFVSIKNDNKISLERYNNGIKFSLMFLGEYFPSKINDFVKKQKINLKDFKNKIIKTKKEITMDEIKKYEILSHENDRLRIEKEKFENKMNTDFNTRLENYEKEFKTNKKKIKNEMER